MHTTVPASENSGRVAIDLPSGLGDQREKENHHAAKLYMLHEEVCKSRHSGARSLWTVGRGRMLCCIDIGYMGENQCIETYSREQILRESAIAPLRADKEIQTRMN